MSGLMDLLPGPIRNWADGNRPISNPSTQVTGPGQQPQQAPGGILGQLGQTVGDLGRGLGQEGLGGLLDVQGMLDRQQAQRELAANFQIIDPKKKKKGQAGNQVTQAEFEQIARNYSDIRMGRTNFNFNPTGTPEEQAQYRRDMMGQMGRIMQTRSGRELLDGLAHNKGGHQVNLGRWSDPTDPENASANPVNEANASRRGVGTSVDVSINPERDNYHIGRNTDAWNATRGDVVLFHELTHALHQVRGTEDQSGKVTRREDRRDANQNIERWEHQAVGLGRHRRDRTPNENAYRRERAQIGASGTGAITPSPTINLPFFGPIPLGEQSLNDRNMPQRRHYGS